MGVRMSTAIAEHEHELLSFCCEAHPIPDLPLLVRPTHIVGFCSLCRDENKFFCDDDKCEYRAKKTEEHEHDFISLCCGAHSATGTDIELPRYPSPVVGWCGSCHDEDEFVCSEPTCEYSLKKKVL